MTVKELFTSVTFEEVAAALRYMYPYDNSIREMASYKEAFDEICHTDFNGDGGKVTFVADERLARHVENDKWENIVGKIVIRPKKNRRTNAELVGVILWGMTYNGYSKLKNFWNFVEDPEYIVNDNDLVYMSRREKLLSQISEFIGTTSYELLRLLILDKKNNILVEICESRAYGKINRADYLEGLISCYGEYIWQNCIGCNNVLAIVTTSHESLATDYEKQIISKLLSNTAKNLSIKMEIQYGIEPNICNTEMNIRIIAFFDKDTYKENTPFVTTMKQSYRYQYSNRL